MSSSPQFDEGTSVLVSEVHSNTDQEIVVVTIDKLQLAVLEHRNALEGSRAWQTPLGVVVAISLTLTTADFKDALKIPKDTWLAIFILSLVISIGWLIRNLWLTYKCRQAEDLVERIKKYGKSSSGSD